MSGEQTSGDPLPPVQRRLSNMISASTPIALGFGITIGVVAFTMGGQKEAAESALRELRRDNEKLVQVIADLRADKLSQSTFAIWVASFRAKVPESLRDSIPDYHPR